MKNWAVGIVSIMMLAGCVTISSSNLPGNASLVLMPQINSGSFNTLGVVHQNVAADVDHLNVYLKIGATEKASKTIPIADVSKAVIFNNLRSGTDYTVLAEAISTASVKISEDASSTITIHVGTNNTPDVATIPVRLTDSTFDGYGTSSIKITDGTYSYSVPESISTQSVN